MKKGVLSISVFTLLACFSLNIYINYLSFNDKATELISTFESEVEMVLNKLNAVKVEEQCSPAFVEQLKIAVFDCINSRAIYVATDSFTCSNFGVLKAIDHKRDLIFAEKDGIKVGYNPKPHYSDSSSLIIGKESPVAIFSAVNPDIIFRLWDNMAIPHADKSFFINGITPALTSTNFQRNNLLETKRFDIHFSFYSERFPFHITFAIPAVSFFGHSLGILLLLTCLFLIYKGVNHAIKKGTAQLEAHKTKL